MIGRSSSMSSGSGRMANGPEKDTAMDVRVRDWCVRCVVRASWAVFSLGFVSNMTGYACGSEHTSSLHSP
jgi:hypothetical protein